ncbi:cell surface protein [Lactiplantibacillus fabifermentans T30PCM01]|uniref:Cell surface protein n=1 Tax=Lactiplantibacillus fabifermentans T30PCM01 TaxID=1400520 RepID=W6T7D2_9LACO|nr:DUF916 and DUF3324 domain-containing protein [Lactiplantibacillus fabifermentans]ETY74172.1 cell surface protein [Lactiplantibacillus fabifermentans T30PCM01]
MKFKRGLLVGLSLLAALWTGIIGQAAKTTTKQSNDIGYSVAAKIPSNQINKNNSYFDLKLQSGQSETLQAVIYNTTNRDIKVQTAVHTAYTNANGVIEYVKPTTTFDPTLRYQMAKLTQVVGAKTVTVPANGSRAVSVKLNLPKTTFNGVILGGWYFKRTDLPVTGTVKQSMMIKNEYSYVLGLKYTLGTVPAPTVKLTNVKAGITNAHRGIFATLQNPTATIISNLHLQATVKSLNSGKVVKKVSQNNVQFAPNSNFSYPMLTGTQPLQAGRYDLHLVLQNSQHRWVFNRRFTINTAAAKKYNADSIDNSGLSIWWLIGLGALGMLVLGLFILWLVLVIKKRRHSTQD